MQYRYHVVFFVKFTQSGVQKQKLSLKRRDKEKNGFLSSGKKRKKREFFVSFSFFGNFETLR